MTKAEREFLSKNLAESSERLLRMAKSLTPEQMRYRPGPGRWTIGENLEHVALAEARLLGLLKKTLDAPPDLSKRSAMEGQDEGLIASVAGREGRREAPEAARPVGQWKEEELLEKFQAARRNTRDFVNSTDVDLRRYFFKHPALGDLDCYQMLLVISAHFDRHRAQCEEVMAAEGFPRAGAARA